MIKIGIVGGTGYTGVELLRLLAAASGGRRPRDHVAQGRRHARSPTCSRACAAATTLAFADPADADLDVVRRRVLRDAARRRDGAGARARRRRREDHRPRRGLPAQGSRGVREVVRDAARLPGPARRIGLRPARGQPRRDPQRAHRRQSRAAIRPPCSSGFLPLLEAGIVDTAHLDRRLQVRRLRRRAARPRWACCSRRPPTTSRPTASRATGTIRRSSRAWPRARGRR